MKPRALILRTAGTNCDSETAHAFELAGAQSVRVHINRIIQNPAELRDFQILAIPGGFSYGDDIAAGRILANQITHHLRDPLREFVEAGKPIIGICNGFQVLIKTELLPGPIDKGLTAQSCTLTNNDCGRFVDRWVRVSPRSRKCVWTAGMLHPVELPVAHGEGKFVPASQKIQESLWENDQVALVYVQADGNPASGSFPANPNGSVGDIAGICDPTGLVLGLMPHPERHLTSLQHPAWSRHTPIDPAVRGEGLAMFEAAVRHVQEAVGVGA